jgi:hypothetical protein
MPPRLLHLPYGMVGHYYARGFASTKYSNNIEKESLKIKLRSKLSINTLM